MKLEKINKTYCILTPQVAGMGGAQLYTLRRIKFLQSRNIKTVLLVSDSPDHPLKEKFNTVDIFQVPEIIFPVFHFPKKAFNLILQNILEKFSIYGSELVIESHTLSISVWGEIIALKLGCRHFIYPLNERPITNWEFMPVKDFYLWKLSRKEFIGPSEYSLRTVLNKYFSHDKAYYSNIGFDPEELNEKSKPDISVLIQKNTFKIGTISRLTKAYVEELIISVISLSKKYPNRTITMIIAGDDPDPQVLENLKTKYQSTDNLRILFPGYINPLGYDFFHNLDVFVGMATAAINSIASRCATITVDPITKKSSGFFGLTSKDTMFAEADLLVPLDHWLEIALTKPSLLQDAKNAGYELFLSDYLAETCMQKIEDFILNSDEDSEYWRFPNSYLSSVWLRLRYNIENSRYYRLLQELYGLRKRIRIG